MKTGTWKGIIFVISIVLGPMLKALSPVIKDLLENSLQKLYDSAKETENPIDDLFVEMLADLVSITLT